jgi:integrase
MTHVLTMGNAALSVVRPPSPEVVSFLSRTYARENARVAGGSKLTIADYMIQVRTLQKFFELELAERDEPPRPVTIDDIDDPLVAGCMAWMKERGLKERTCNKLRRTIKTIHSFALNEKDLPGRPLRVKKFKEPKKKRFAWRPEQIGRLLEAALSMPGFVGDVPAGKWHYAHLMFLLNTGTRITAAMNTPSATLDLDQGWVTVPAEVQKHDEDEVFDLLPDTIEALRAIRPHRHKCIFDAWPYDRSVDQWPALLKRLKQMLVRAGLFPSIKDIPKRVEFFHKLRRCFGTFIAIKAGRRAAQEGLGHSHESVTNIYIDDSQMDERPKFRELLADMIVTPKHDPQKKLFD